MPRGLSPAANGEPTSGVSAPLAASMGIGVNIIGLSVGLIDELALRIRLLRLRARCPLQTATPPPA